MNARLALLLVFLIFSATNDEKKKEAPITPKEVIPLFNGKDLTGLTTWLNDTKHDDPKKVFTVHDGLLHISGDGMGYIATSKEYRNYHLVVEFKWGERTWAGRKDKAKDSGVLLHAAGADGNSGGVWMASIECNIIQGGVGDIIVIPGKDAAGAPLPVSAAAEVEKDRDGEEVWKKGGEKKVFKGGRINWYGRDPDWKDEIGFRGKNDVESPGSEWTRIDIIADGGRLSIQVNGKLVNEASDAAPQAGKILLQSEGAEIIFRKWELHPLKK
ncbi:MAG: DUF1080 domain-containing protein [Planctomycetes bacterium]|nr:DUF1080 domain-containing protein [Planctomycetota bacterium]